MSVQGISDLSVYSSSVLGTQKQSGVSDTKSLTAVQRESASQDTYVPGDAADTESAGIYSLVSDGQGGQTISFDAPAGGGAPAGGAPAGGAAQGAGGASSSSSTEDTTDDLEDELEDLEEEKEDLQRQLENAEDEAESQKLEQQIKSLDTQIQMKQSQIYMSEEESDS
jgi:hypothetical protein